MKESQYPYLSGLKDKDLKQIFIESRRLLKERNLLKYDVLANDDKLFFNRNICKHTIRKRKIKSNLIIEEKNPGPNITIFTKNLLSRTNSILIDWLHEDWSYLFPYANNEDDKYYVYCHINPIENSTSFYNKRYKDQPYLVLPGDPFYIGKGCGNRAFDFGGRSTSHISKIKSLLNKGYTSNRIALIIETGLTELEALELESKLIAFFGCMAEIPNNFKYWHGGSGGYLVNSDLGKRPEWVNDLINQLIIFKSKR